MKLLAVETSTEACSAALYIGNDDAVGSHYQNDSAIISEQYTLAPKAHTQLILPMIDSLMAEAGLKPQQLDALAFSRGPGSFTGIRIATGIIHGIALGTDLPVVPVSTLAAIAQHFFEHQQQQDTAFVTMDARMNEIFWAVYQQDQCGYAELLGNETVTPAESVEFPDRQGVGIGSGWGVYAEVLTKRLTDRIKYYESQHLPRAHAIARLAARDYQRGLAVPVEQAMPVYLRDKVAQTESERQKAASSDKSA